MLQRRVCNCFTLTWEDTQLRVGIPPSYVLLGIGVVQTSDLVHCLSLWGALREVTLGSMFL